MKSKIVKLGSVLLLTTALLTACNKPVDTETETPVDTETEEATVNESSIKEGYNVIGVELGAYDLMPFKSEFDDYQTKEEWLKENKSINMDSILKIADNQRIESFNAPIDPENEDIVYLSTTVWNATGDNDLSSLDNRILSYNLKTGEAEELYAEESDTVLRTIAMDDNKLIVLFDVPDNSPGPCTSYWLFDKPTFGYGYLDITKPEAGLQEYVIPEYKLTEAETASTKCLGEFGAG